MMEGVGVDVENVHLKLETFSTCSQSTLQRWFA